ncbi:MAG TPA: hypothetical protein VGS08_01665 [Candidatus Saccharimonadales bacterium]|nr:hypothetical protein [Candidatus Saccharimonadales bacterium]
MLTQTHFQSAIAAAIRSSSDDLGQDFARLKHLHVTLPIGEQAYITLSRVKNQWRLPRDTLDSHHSDRLLLLPMRANWYKPNAYLTVVPQPIIMHRKIAAVLETYAARLFQHYAIEDTLARREHGVPMLVGRFDVIVDKQGNIQICELDDVCSLWPALPDINPVAETYLRALENQLGMPIYTSELFQYPDGPSIASPRIRQDFARISFYDDSGEEQVAYIQRSTPLELAILEQNGVHWRTSQKPTDRRSEYYEHLLQPFYAHNEDHWHGDIHEEWLLHGKRFGIDEVALSVRAYRDMPGFAEHMNRYGPRSITMAWQRDSKWPLVPEKLAVLAANLDVAAAFGSQWETENPGQLLVFKTLYSARTGHTAIYSNRGTKPKGVSCIQQIERKFGKDADKPIVIQPYKEPESLAEVGVQFIGTQEESLETRTYTDRTLIRSVEHYGNQNPGERVIAGMEGHFKTLLRSFVVYLPKEKRLIHIGGMWQATDGRIIHGGSHSVAGPLYIEGLMGHKDSKRTKALEQAERMVNEHSRKV